MDERYGMPMINRKDWDFDHRAERDSNRHNEKVKEAIKNNLDNIVSDGTIITADPNGKRQVRVPLRSLELPHIRYGEPKEGIGTGNGEGTPQPGDEVGQGPGAGNQPGEEWYEAEFSVEEIQKMVFEDLGLPNFKPKTEKTLTSATDVFTDIRKKRSMTNLDLGRTIMENMMRNARENGKVEIKNISSEDFRVRTWEQEDKPENSAVVIAMADISASMGDFEKYVTRAFCWWTVSFLRSKYPKVDIVFVAHDTEAQEVTEEQFFTRGAGGGTLCSSANRMALDMINTRFPTENYNVYPLHFSDGDNWSEDDNATCVNLISEMLNKDISQYAYVQIGKDSRSRLLTNYDDNIHDKRFKGIMIDNKEDVLAGLKQVFSLDQENR